MAEIVPHPVPSSEAVPVQSVTHVDALPVGTRLLEFEIQGLLGVGGFGLVYRAYDTSLLRTVAIKEYMPAALAGRAEGATVSVRSSADEGTYRSGLQSFIAEARLLAQFDHPSLVKVYRFFEAHNTAYMVMPLYSGMTLKQARRLMTAPPPEAWLRSVLWSVLQGLHVLHRSDTLHRDVSPDNIFLQNVGPPVLLDLGAARRALTDKSQKVTTVLKVNYAPIEQFAEAEDLKQGPWTDLYSLAAVVYSCLRNDPPLPATARVVRDSQPSVRNVVATVKKHFGLGYSDDFVRAVQHALAVQPAERPQSLSAFVTEMKLKAPPRLSKFDWRAEIGNSLQPEEDYNSRQFLETMPVTQELDPVPASAKSLRPASGRRPRWPLALLGGMAVALLAVGLFWGLRGQDGPGSQPLVAAPEPAAVPAPVAVAAPEPAVAEPVAEAPVVPATVPVAEPRPKPHPVAAPVKPAPVPKPVAVEEEHKPAPRPVPVESQTAPQPKPAPVAVKRELCADANFFTRSMCVHQECKKPENAQLPACIEDRQRYPEGGTGSP